MKLTYHLQGKLLVYSCQSIGERFVLVLPQVILVWRCLINALKMNKVFNLDFNFDEFYLNFNFRSFCLQNKCAPDDFSTQCDSAVLEMRNTKSKYLGAIRNSIDDSKLKTESNVRQILDSKKIYLRFLKLPVTNDISWFFHIISRSRSYTILGSAFTSWMIQITFFSRINTFGTFQIWWDIS